MDDVVKTTVWLEDARDFSTFNAVYARHFPKDPPARTTVESRLMIDIKIEVEAVPIARPEWTPTACRGRAGAEGR